MIVRSMCDYAEQSREVLNGNLPALQHASHTLGRLHWGSSLFCEGINEPVSPPINTSQKLAIRECLAADGTQGLVSRHPHQ